MHSCRRVPVADHLRGKPPQIRAACNALLKAVRRFGPVRIGAVKSRLLISGRAHFAGVDVRQGRLRIEFLLDRSLESPRVQRVVRVTDTSFSHFVQASTAADVDAQLLGWLKAAYELRR